MKINEIITESLDNPFKWAWIKRGGTKKGSLWKAAFKVDEEDVIEVTINETFGYWDIEFVDKSSKDTSTNLGKYQALRTLSTVVDIVKNFIGQVNPEVMQFTASTLGINRASAYEKILDRELPDNYQRFESPYF